AYRAAVPVCPQGVSGRAAKIQQCQGDRLGAGRTAKPRTLVLYPTPSVREYGGRPAFGLRGAQCIGLAGGGLSGQAPRAAACSARAGHGPQIQKLRADQITNTHLYGKTPWQLQKFSYRSFQNPFPKQRCSTGKNSLAKPLKQTRSSSRSRPTRWCSKCLRLLPRSEERRVGKEGRA